MMLAWLAASPMLWPPAVAWADEDMPDAVTSQDDNDRGEEDEDDEGIGWFAVPTLGSSPETGFYVGAAGLIVFPTNAPPEVAQRTSLDAEFQVTMRRQVRLDNALVLVLGQGDWLVDVALHLGIEPDFFYGVGNKTPTDFERYDARSVSTDTGFKHALGDSRRLYAGAFYHFNAIAIDPEPGGRLATAAVPGVTGGLVSAPGVELYWDGRDSALVPRAGSFLNVKLQRASALLGSDFAFTRTIFDARHYLAIGRDHVFAGRALLNLGIGDVPVFEMGMLGGETLMRGTYRGRFRDKSLAAVQGEYRSPLIWRLRFNVFTALGQVGPTVADLIPSTDVKWTTGLGTRIKIDEEVYIRVDWATLLANRSAQGKGFGIEETGFYISANEAF